MPKWSQPLWTPNWLETQGCLTAEEVPDVENVESVNETVEATGEG
jgi:hypothetical protein